MVRGVNLAPKWGLREIEVVTDSATVCGWVRLMLSEEKRIKTNESCKNTGKEKDRSSERPDRGPATRVDDRSRSIRTEQGRRVDMSEEELAICWKRREGEWRLRWSRESEGDTRDASHGGGSFPVSS